MNSFETYNLYLSLKHHFRNKSYDYFQYHGKTKANVESFNTHKNKYFFEKISKRKDVFGYLLANISEDNNIWIGMLASDPKCEHIYNGWLKRKQSLSYIFSQDLDKLNAEFDANFKVINDDYPVLFKKYSHGEICLETLIILNMIVDFFPYWNKKISDPIVWPTLRFKCEKYQPFMEVKDLTNFRKIVLDKFG